MNALLFNQFFPPDSAPTGRLLADVASYLAGQGHHVTVVCSRSGYVHSEETSASRPVGLHCGVSIVRVPGMSFSHRPLGRLLSWLSYFAGAVWYGFRLARPELVLTLTTPPLLGLVGNLLRLRGARHIIWEMDLYPDVAKAVGAIRPGSWLERTLGVVADSSRGWADGTIALGPCMRDRIVAKGTPISKVHVAENWAAGDRIRPLPLPTMPPLTLLYSGNLGLAHDVGTITRAMESLESDERFRFVFAGGGPRRQMLADVCSTLSNVSFLGYQNEAQLSEHLASCHVGLVTQNAACIGTVVPSKVYALMAAARAVIFIGPQRATPALNIQRYGCGWQVEPGDADGLVALLRRLAADPDDVARAGQRGREAFLQHYDLPIGVERVCAAIESLTGVRVSL